MANPIAKWWKNIDWGNVGKGALGGAATGASVGAAGGGIGSAIGGAAGGLLGAILAAFEGKATPEQTQLISQFAPGLQEKIDEMAGGLIDRLGSDQFDFGPIRANAEANFQNRTIPSIVERLHGLTGGAGSDVFGKQLGLAGAELNRGLAADEQGYNMQRRAQDVSLLGLARQQPTGQFGAPSQGEQLFQYGTQQLGPVIGDLMARLKSGSGSKTSMAPGGIQMTPEGNMFSPVSYGGR